MGYVIGKNLIQNVVHVKLSLFQPVQQCCCNNFENNAVFPVGVLE